MALRDDLVKALRAADAAGDTESARHLADQINRLPEDATGYTRSIIDQANKLSGKNLNAARALEATQGLTLGWGDELAGVMGGLDSLVRGKSSRSGESTFSGGYNSTAEKARDDLKRYEAERPVEALGVNVAGSLPGLVAGASLAPAIARSGKALSLANRVKSAAAAGALYGGVSGAGYGDKDRLSGAEFGALTGGGLGMLLPFVPAGVRGVKRLITRTGQAPDNFAATALSRALESDSVPLSSINPNRPLIDAGAEATSALAEQGALEGAGRKAAETFFKNDSSAREAKLIDRIRDTISNGGLYDRLDELATKRSADATPLYREAYSQQYRRTPKLVDLSKRPAIGGAARSAITRLKNDPDLDPQEVQQALGSIFGNDLANLSDEEATRRLTQAMGSRPVEFKVLDYIKRGLDAMAEDPSASREIRKLRSAWREELKAINPKYQEALNAWAGPSATMDAMAEGRAFDKLDPEAITRLLSNMGESEQEAYRLGVARRLQDLASGASSKSPGQNTSLSLAKGISGNSVMKRRLTAALGSQGASPAEMLRRNGWSETAPGVFRNTTKPNQVINLTKDGTWSLEQTSKTGRSSSVKNAGPDQTSLETFLTGHAPTKPRLAVEDLLDLADDIVTRNDKRNTIIGNSATARRAAGSQEFDQAGKIIDQVGQSANALKHGGGLGFLGHWLGVTKDALLEGLTSKRREAISKLLYSDNPQDNLKALEMIKQIRQGRTQGIPVYRGGMVAPAAGITAGRDQ